MSQRNASSTQPEHQDPLLGRQLANFRLERVIGRGGMAQVYYGWDIKLERPVALKVIDARYRGKADYAERFVREARAVAAWHHPNITQIFYADDEDGLYFYAMEFIDGLDLGALIGQYADDGELMPINDVVRVGRAVAAALDHAHERGIIHRDVKPSNVMVAHDGRVLLTDFGLAMDAKQGSLGDVFGSPHYMAPEQARHSASAVPQSDLYSLAVILYELLTGIPPFDDPAPAALALQHITEPVPNPREINPYLNEQTAAVLLKALSKIPDERYPSGNALLNALAMALDAGSSQVPPPLPPSVVPLPAGVTPNSERRTASLTVSERIALHLEKNPSPVREVTPTAASRLRAAVEPRRVRVSPLLLGVIGILLVAGLVLVGRAILMDDAPPAVVVVTPSPSNTPRSTASPAPEIPTSSTVPPAIIQPPATDTPVPTATATERPTTTPTITPTPSATPSPTVLYPDGRLMRLVYNDTGFYLLNLSDARIEARRLTFELLPNAANDATYRFSGQEWALFYPFVEADGCNFIELFLLGVEPIRPGICEEINASKADIDPDNRIVFWLGHETGASQFRVLWNEAEVGRCELGRSRCDIYLP